MGIKSYHPIADWAANAEQEARLKLSKGHHLVKITRQTSPRIHVPYAEDHPHERVNGATKAFRKGRITLAKLSITEDE